MPKHGNTYLTYCGSICLVGIQMDEHISWELMQANNNVALIVPTSEALLADYKGNNFIHFIRI